VRIVQKMATFICRFLISFLFFCSSVRSQAIFVPLTMEAFSAGSITYVF